jgi:transposase
MQGKVMPEQDAPLAVYVGIDVCKAHLDVHLHPLGQQFRVQNTTTGLRQIKRRLVGLEVVRIVLEATSKFHRQAWRTLHVAGHAVAPLNPLRGRLFVEAKGWLAKTDRLDARSLAVLGEAMQPPARAPMPEQVEQLDELVRARQQAVAERTALSNRRGTCQNAFLKAELDQRLAELSDHIKRLQRQIELEIGQDEGLLGRYAILRSMPGVGPVVAAVLLTALSELGTCSAKAIALLTGLAPIARDSGNSRGQRHIRGGREHVRSVLYMAALSATTHNPSLKAFYDRLIQQGKAQKLAITAVMRKMVVLANTLISENRPWATNRP